MTTSSKAYLKPAHVQAAARRPGLLARIANTLLTWQTRANQRHQLRGLSNDTLKDIGISRADVDREVSKPFWRP